MICPLKFSTALPETQSEDFEKSVFFQCHEKTCAWWFKGKVLECCSIKLLARSVLEQVKNIEGKNDK